MNAARAAAVRRLGRLGALGLRPAVCYDDAAMGSRDDPRLDEVARRAARHPGLRLLMLFGSRAREEARDGSDWDWGYLGQAPFDPLALLADLVETLRTDRIDLVDLAGAGGQLRFRAARDGRPVFAADPDAFPAYWLEAVSFWCEAGPVIQAGYRKVLASLSPGASDLPLADRREGRLEVGREQTSS